MCNLRQYDWPINKYFIKILHTLSYNVQCTLGCPKKTAFSVKNSMAEGKRKLESRRVRKYIRFFLILFIPGSSNCKKKSCRGCSENSYEFTSFSIFYPTKNPRKKNVISFSVISYLLRSIKQNLRIRTTYFFGFGFCALLERRVDKIKNSESKILLKLPRPSFARYHRIFNFWDTLMYIHTYIV